MERPRMIRALRWISGLTVGLGFLYLGCLVWPQPFFSYHLRAPGNVRVYLTEPAPPELSASLAEAASLLSRSPLYDTSFGQHVFICGSLRQFGFFTRGQTYLGGLCDNRLSRNIFIHPADLRAGRLQAYYGWRDDRPLSYFIAHEITHSLCSHYLGRWKRVPTWLWEGYAEYIGRRLDSVDVPELLHSTQLDRRARIYDTYGAYVTFLLIHRDIRSLLTTPPPFDSVVRGTAAFADSMTLPTGRSAR